VTAAALLAGLRPCDAPARGPGGSDRGVATERETRRLIGCEELNAYSSNGSSALSAAWQDGQGVNQSGKKRESMHTGPCVGGKKCEFRTK
jgi:hypothetical protein